MNIAFLAHDKKKELIVQFCTAYKSVLQKHDLFATATTGRLIRDNTGLPITLLLSHKQGGHQQINARIAYNEIDLVLMFTDPNISYAAAAGKPLIKYSHFGAAAAAYKRIAKRIMGLPVPIANR